MDLMRRISRNSFSRNQRNKRYLLLEAVQLKPPARLVEQLLKMAHSAWKCNYHIVWCTKYRSKILEGEICHSTSGMLKEICELNQLKILEQTIEEDHIHLLVEIPPKLSVSKVIRIIKSKLATELLIGYEELRNKFRKGHLWARGYYVRTVGHDLEQVKKYVRNHGQIRTNQTFWSNDDT
jgi:putative transposase